MYMPSVRCMVYVKGLGEAYMTLDRRALLLLYQLLYLALYLLLLLTLMKNKQTEPCGRFQNY